MQLTQISRHSATTCLSKSLISDCFFRIKRRVNCNRSCSSGRLMLLSSWLAVSGSELKTWLSNLYSLDKSCCFEMKSLVLLSVWTFSYSKGAFSSLTELIFLCKLPTRLLSSVWEQKHAINSTLIRWATSFKLLTSAFLLRISDFSELLYFVTIVLMIVSKCSKPLFAINSTSQLAFKSLSHLSVLARIISASKVSSSWSSVAYWVIIAMSSWSLTWLISRLSFKMSPFQLKIYLLEWVMILPCLSKVLFGLEILVFSTAASSKRGIATPLFRTTFDVAPEAPFSAVKSPATLS